MPIEIKVNELAVLDGNEYKYLDAFGVKGVRGEGVPSGGSNNKVVAHNGVSPIWQSLKTINNRSILGEGNITVSGGMWGSITGALTNQLDLKDALEARPTLDSLAAVATTGSYADLSGKPTLHLVAETGSYTDLKNRPTLSSVATSGNYDDLNGKPNLASVATSGSYTDLINKPTIDTALSTTSTNAVTNSAIANKFGDIVDVINRYASLTLSTTEWSAATYNGESCYKVAKTLSGSSEANSHPFVGLSLTSQATADEEIEAFNLIYEAWAGDNVITFYATDKPSSNFTVQVKGW